MCHLSVCVGNTTVAPRPGHSLYESPVCGNGFVEPGEQCDCGLPEDCKNPCCDASTCMLKEDAVCGTGQCCDLTVSGGRSAGGRGTSVSETSRALGELRHDRGCEVGSCGLSAPGLHSASSASPLSFCA